MEAVETNTTSAAAVAVASGAPKKRKVERRERLRKTALCKHFDKPGGCPFPNCKFAHGWYCNAFGIARRRASSRCPRLI